jgi:hypothetical protein
MSSRSGMWLILPCALDTSFIQRPASGRIDILMPQDGFGAGDGAPSLDDLPEYFSAMQSAYYPVEASELNRQYRLADDLLPLISYQLLSPPTVFYPDTETPSKLLDRTGGGYDGFSLGSCVGFADGSGYRPAKSLGT